MADDMISKPRAKGVRLLSQAGALVFVLAGVGAVVFGVPMLAAPDVETVAYADVRAEADELYQGILQRREGDGDDEDEPLMADRETIVEALNQIKNAPETVTDEPEDTDGDDGDDDEPAPPPGPGPAKTRFLGTVQIGDRMHALLSAGGAQRILAPDAEAVLPLAPGEEGEAPRVRVLSVAKGEVRLVEDDAERTVTKAPRSGVAVTTSVASVTPVTSSDAGDSQRNRAVRARSGENGVEADQIPPVNPDDFRREDGTIDYEALREAARERARERQALRRQRREEQGNN